MIDYLDDKIDDESDELTANGSYFICLDVVKNKMTGYYK